MDPKRMKAYGDAIDGDNELTPRPSRHQRSASSRASSQSEDSNEDARTTSSTQSTSAIKTFADLQFALRPTIYETLDGSSAARLKGVLKKYKALKQLSSGIAIIPESVRPRLQSTLHPDDYPPGFAYKASGGQHAQYETRICDEVFRIHTQAHYCDKTRQAEPTWNAQVYAQSVNQTMVASLRQKPIVINWESKRPYTGGESSDIQLSIWLGAQLARLREMLDLVAETNDKGKGKVNKGKAIREKNVLLPALSAHGHDVDLLVFEEQESENVLYGRLRLGSLSTVHGIFQILGGLEVLVDWAHTDYRSWFAEKVVRTK
ncbi:MAG: hypothetical protein LQ342_006734 [Letrouitia transgressa]|nr:MAG: hypothetical protein LQ342_006734 [Letrouitia transgressa]